MIPMISVCVPTYKGTQYLKDCLNSILEQSFTNFELLIIDDCSGDNTVDIAQEYAAEDQRIRIIVNESNLGLVGNWNRCVELAQGKWIKFVFQDDLIAPNCLEKMLTAAGTETNIIACKRDFIFEAGIPQNERNYYLNLPSLDESFANVREISAQDYCQTILNYISRIYLNFVGEPTTVMLRRSIFYRLGFFNPYLIQACDIEFWHRVCIHTGITFVPETLATFRIHENSTTNINQESRNYRKNTLEWLIILHDFVYHPNYTPLRDAANKCQPQINLTGLLADKAYDAKRIVERSQDSQLRQEWEDFLQLYPIFSEISQRSLFKRMIYHGIYQWKKFQKFLKT